MPNLSDNEIIKASENCPEKLSLMACKVCPLNDLGCAKYAFDLINRQKEAIYYLSKDVKDLTTELKTTKSEAYKEFAKRLKEELITSCDRVCEESGLSIYGVITGYPINDVEECIDNLLKEMG